MYRELLSKEYKLSVVGLGYVGLPLALEFARKYKVIGFDINPKVIDSLNNKIDPAGEVESEKFEGTDIEFTTDENKLSEAKFFVIAVPTPIDQRNLPDITLLLKACSTVGRHLKKGDYVVMESTVYPGCTEEDCIPVLEEVSGLKCGKDFKVGYSPERINPGDKVHTLKTVVKITSGCDQESADEIANIYGEVVEAGIHKAPSIKVAEAAKIIENTQRDVNIAIMNELSGILNTMNINTFDVIEAAGTKWNFLKFTPGLVGGHCIGVDPYYFIYKAKELGYQPRLFMAARELNDGMGQYIAQQTIKLMAKNNIAIPGSKIAILGFTYKENVSDIRNTKIADIIKELQEYNVQLDIVDPRADKEEVEKEYGISLADQLQQDYYDVVILAVAHNEYKDMTEDDFKKLLKNGNGIFIDIKGIARDKIKDLVYWSL